jgi:undecaprenyl-diphosphatase
MGAAAANTPREGIGPGATGEGGWLARAPGYRLGMLTSAFWGLIQGITEFLPISSSGHLVLIPALVGVDEPDLATTAVLHLGSLSAVLWYYRSDFAGLVTSPFSDHSRRVWLLLIIGTIPAAIAGLTLDGPLEIIFSEPWMAAVALIITGLVIGSTMFLSRGSRTLEDARIPDALLVGMAQAFALVPGISRSGMTITAGLAQGLSRVEAARFAFLLGVPAIAGAGLLQTLELVDRGGFEPELLVGVVTAAISGYFAIAFLVRLIGRIGIAPYAAYCIAFGALAYILL